MWYTHILYTSPLDRQTDPTSQHYLRPMKKQTLQRMTSHTKSVFCSFALSFTYSAYAHPQSCMFELQDAMGEDLM